VIWINKPVSLNLRKAIMIKRENRVRAVLNSAVCPKHHRAAGAVTTTSAVKYGVAGNPAPFYEWPPTIILIILRLRMMNIINCLMMFFLQNFVALVGTGGYDSS
jgi:hypothetical protein